MPNILIADDHPIFRKGLKEILAAMLVGSKIFELEDGKEVIAFVEKDEIKIDVYILDVDMPYKNGIELCRFIKHKNSEAKVIILTMHNQEDIFFESLEAKADGFVLKENSAKELDVCIKEILHGNIYVSKDLRVKQLDFGRHIRDRKKLNNQLTDLSQAELKTLRLVGQGYTSKEIAKIMFVTSKSVDNYRSRICKKLNIEAGSRALINWIAENKQLLKL